MQKEFRHYHLMTELAKRHSHSSYLAYTADEPENQVVLTVFASSLFRFPHERENLLKKAKHIKDLQHPHVVPLLDLGIEQEQPFVVRPYWPDGCLRDRLKQLSPGRLPLGEAFCIVSQVGQALLYAHERHIVHGNIKPENLLLDAAGQVLVADFSLVEQKDAIIRDQTSQEYAFCYLAPEQFSGTYDARSDQYALGCLAYELITGRIPFAVQSLASMMGSQSHTNLAPLSQSVADLPPSLEVAILKALAHDPDQRFFDFSLFLEVIESVLSPSPAFPLLRSTYPGKKRPRQAMPSTKTATLSSPIRKRATKRTSESSCSPAHAEMKEAAHPDRLADVNKPDQERPLVLTESLTSALQSTQLFLSSHSQDANPLSTREQADLPHPLKGQIDSQSAALTVATITPLEEQTMVTPSIKPEPDATWLTDLSVKQEESGLPISIDLLSPDENSQALSN